MHQPPNDHLRRRVLRLHRPHNPRALDFGERVCHVPNLGTRRLFETIAHMTAQETESLKRHFLDWSGGFEPESLDQITVYVDYACSVLLNPEEAKRTLITWMNSDSSVAAE